MVRFPKGGSSGWNKLRRVSRLSGAAVSKAARVGAQRSGLNTITSAVSAQSATLFAALSQPDILKEWLDIGGSASVYDKAMDAEYIKTHLHGGNHRMFDGGHSLWDAWHAVREARPDDSLYEEVQGYVDAVFKDMSTVKGLPFATLDPSSFDAWADALQAVLPWVDRSFIYDLLSFDTMEVFNAALGAAALVFGLGADDRTEVSRMLGSMGVVSIVSANPLLGIVAIATVAKAYKTGMKPDVKAFAGAGALAALSSGMFMWMGLPILVELVIVLTLTRLAKRGWHSLEDSWRMRLGRAVVGRRAY